MSMPAAVDAGPAEVAAGPRPGPRPLPLHLANAVTLWTGAAAALPAFQAGVLPWHPSLGEKARTLHRSIGETGWQAVGREVVAQSQQRLAAALDGIEAYRRHPYRRVADVPPSRFTLGAMRLLDYGGPGRPTLVIPSLVNPSYILDLLPERSLMRYLKQRGLRPLLVDWGAPGDEERGYCLDDYIVRRLEPALDHVAQLAGGPAPVIGYCMGGTMALGLAARGADRIGQLALLATPWDFHAPGSPMAPVVARALDVLMPSIDRLGAAPVDVLQLFFTSLDPTLAERKFRKFARVDASSDQARLFVALEDWANDGPPLAAAVARECLVDWYRCNLPGRGLWRVADTPVRPERLDLPLLVAVPGRDRIVPPDSALAVATACPAAACVRPPSGHVGMVVGNRAASGLWQPLADWLCG